MKPPKPVTIFIYVEDMVVVVSIMVITVTSVCKRFINKKSFRSWNSLRFCAILLWDVWSCLIQLKKSLEKIEAFPAQVPQRDRLVLGTFYGQWCHITSGSKLVLRLRKMMITDFLLSTTRWKCGDRKKRIIKVFWKDFALVHFHFYLGSFSTFAKFSEKITFLNLHIRTRRYAYQGVRNFIFFWKNLQTY